MGRGRCLAGHAIATVIPGMSKLHVLKNGTKILAKRVGKRVDWQWPATGVAIASKTFDSAREARAASLDLDKATVYARE
jgi:hypothetical protein